MALEAKIKLTLVDKVTKKLDSINNSINRTNTLAGKMGNAMSYWPKSLQESINKAKKLKEEFKKNNSLVEDMGRKLKSIFAAYGGVMTIRAVIQTSDTITGAENRLNYSNGGDTKATETAMDKMYAASLRSRSNYGDMLSNVGKSMALASDSFQGNVDNAIRFQEVMAKSYAIGGASAAEQSSSMYQMIQALGSGVLQGDELRSVREGAPLAYKAIEEFAQGVYDTDKSLKDLASQGKITSDIVVAAMMQAGDGIDKAFEDTNMTISQAFTNMKTVAVNSFRPIQDTINGFLNSETGTKFINGISVAIQGLIGVLGTLVNIAVNAATWIVNNWYWVQWIIYAIGIAIMYVAAVAIGQILWKAILKIAATGALAWLPWLFLIAGVIAAIVWLANTAKDGCDFIYNVCYILAMAIIGVLAVVLVVYLATGTVMLSMPMLIALMIIAVAALVVMVIAKYGEQIGTFIGAVVAFIYNLVVGLINAIIQNFWNMFVEPFIGIVEWILNVCNGGFDSFGGRVANLIGQIISWFLSLGKVVTKIIDAIFGTNWTGGLESLQSSILKWGKNDNAITLSREAPTINSITNGYLPDRLNYGDSMATGAGIGASAQNGINSLFNKAKGGLSGLGGKITGGIDKALNIDRNFDANNPDYGLSTANYDPNKLAKGIGDTADNTGKMADSMALAEEDLDYLRRVANMEWKKEFTTASITVNMDNNNTINNQGDLNGWAISLRDMLAEELDAVANGVYA